jgi:uronate dehydrogenase
MTGTERVLITGAAGGIGRMLRSRLARPGRSLRLLDVVPVLPAGASEEAVRASITDMAAMEYSCEGVQAIIHLGAISGEAPWKDILEVNIHGTYTVFEAARRQGVSRVVFASSNHAVGFYPRERGPAPDYLFPMPDTYYGVSKAAGEALGSLYHSRYGMDVVCIRIMYCFEKPYNIPMLTTWLSPDDAGRIFEASLSAPRPGYRVIWGVSANQRAWYSQAEASALGYEPKDDAEQFAASFSGSFAGPDPSGIEERLLGGEYCGPEYDADRLG